MVELQTEWIERCNPIKLKEYLALGFPVGSAPSPELEPYRDFVTAAAPEDFAEAVAAAVDAGSHDTADGASRRELMGKSIWNAVSAQVKQALKLP